MKTVKLLDDVNVDFQKEHTQSPKKITWEKLVKEAMALHNETMDDVVSMNCNPKQLRKRFYEGYGEEHDASGFTLWTKNRVYFPVCCEGYEYVGSAQRNPSSVVG